MLFPEEPHLDRQDKLFIALLVSIPFAIAVLLYALSMQALVKYEVLGIVAILFSLFVLSYPKAGVLFGVFYIYAGLSFYFRFHAGYPIITLVVVAAVLDVMRGGSIRLRKGSFIWPLVFFTVFAVQSMLFSYSIEYSLTSFAAFARGTILTFLIVQFIRSKRDLESLMLIVFLGGVSSVLLGVLNIKLGLVENISVISGVNFLRFSGTFMNPNMLAVFLVSAVPMGIYLMKKFRGVFFRIMSFLGVMIMLIGALSTFSRAAILPIVVMTLIIFVRETRHRKALFILFAVVSVFAAMLFIPAFYWDRILSLGDIDVLSRTDWSLYLRLKAAIVALQLFAQHPLTGVGLKNFIVRSGSELFARIHVHNIYLEILVGVGLFGFISFMLIYWAALWECLQGIRRKWTDELAYMQDLSFYIMTSVLAGMLSGLFFSEPFSYSIWIPMAAALILGNLRRDVHEKGE